MQSRILIIEDHVPSRELMAYLLVASGHEVVQAKNGRAGLEAAKAGAFDAIVCDVLLPDVGGEELVRKLRSNPRQTHLPLIAVTIISDGERLLAAGFDGFIPKPIEPRTFARQIREFTQARFSHAPALLPGGPHVPKTQE